MSGRQRQVLVALLRGQSEKECAAALDVRVHTVHTHVKAIYGRCGVNSRAELMSLWVPPAVLCALGRAVTSDPGSGRGTRRNPADGPSDAAAARAAAADRSAGCVA